MKPNVIISFASGILVSTAVSGFIYLSSDDNSHKTVAATIEAPSEKEMKETLASSGYLILTEEELEKKLVASKPEKTKTPTEKETVVYRTVVNVAPGMTSIDVGRALVHGKIIDSANTFFKEVEKRGLSNDLKPGTFELDSNMTMDEVMSVIFK